MKKYFTIIAFSLLCLHVFGQQKNYWQQHVDYTMDIDVDAEKYQFKGKQKLVYTNNSPDGFNQQPKPDNNLTNA